MKVSKLVRDKIPEIIGRNGRLVSIKYVSGEEHCRYLLMKLNEEVRELRRNVSIEEVADVLEVLDAILKVCLNASLSDALRVKERKKELLGGFEGGAVATYITD